MATSFIVFSMTSLNDMHAYRGRDIDDVERVLLAANAPVAIAFTLTM